MGRNTRGLPAQKAVAIRPDKATALLAQYDQDRLSCKVRKLGLQHVVKALAASGGHAPLIAKIMNDKKGEFKVAIGETPIRLHVTRRCSCYRNGTVDQNGS